MKKIRVEEEKEEWKKVRVKWKRKISVKERKNEKKITMKEGKEEKEKTEKEDYKNKQKTI